MKNVWSDLKKPFFVLAPMDDVTDTVFRRIVARHGRPDVFVTEFTNTDAMCSQGEESALRRLLYTEEERPIIAQIWGTTPKHYFEAAKKIADMGFDGIDINMGCPVRDVIKAGACSALINNPNLAKDLIEAVREGARSASRRMPLSVKTRIGFGKIQTEEWLGFLLKQQLDALIVHARTAKEMSDVPAHWEEITKVVKLRDSLKVPTVIIGNGDVQNRKDGLEKAQQTGVDGIMIGRGVFHDLFAFREDDTWESLDLRNKLSILQEHVTLFSETWGEKKSFNLLKKFFKIYISGFPGASEMRVEFMNTSTYTEALLLAEKKLHELRT